MQLITIADFEGEIAIPARSDSATVQRLNVFINKYQPKFMRQLFGKDMASAFEIGMAADPVEQRWTDLSNDSVLKNMLSCFVFYWWTRDAVTQNSKTGVVKPDNQNSTAASASDKMVKAWNDMWEEVLQYSVDVSIYPEYSRYSIGCHWREVFYPINSFNI